MNIQIIQFNLIHTKKEDQDHHLKTNPNQQIYMLIDHLIISYLLKILKR